MSGGTGLLVNGFFTEATAGGNQGADLWIGGGCQFYQNATGIDVAGSAGGIHIEDSDISKNGYGIIIEAPASSTDLYRNTQVFIGHIAIDSNVNIGLHVGPRALETLRLVGTWCSSNGVGVAPAPTPVSDFTTNGAQIDTPQITSAVTSDINVLTINIADCRFHHNGGHGLAVSSAQLLNVVGSTFDYNGAHNNPNIVNGHGVFIASSDVHQSNITGNMFISNGSGGTSSDVSDKYGAGLCLAYQVDNVLATGNDTLGNLYNTGGIYGAGLKQNTVGGSTGATNRLLSVGTTSPLNQ